MKLARVNTCLLIAIFLIDSFVIVFPFLPALMFQQQIKSPEAKQIQKTVVSQSLPHSIDATAAQLLIPAMVLDEPIHEGKNLRTLRQGLWRLPYTSTPDKGGNTVIVAHRFTYTNPRGTFYHLDKVKVGDPIAILWHGKKYTYTIDQVRQVPPTQTSVEAATKEARLTLYTCTPLWNPKDRLVVTASLETIE